LVIVIKHIAFKSGIVRVKGNRYAHGSGCKRSWKVSDQRSTSFT
jgi:hypothetical protein